MKEPLLFVLLMVLTGMCLAQPSISPIPGPTTVCPAQGIFYTVNPSQDFTNCVTYTWTVTNGSFSGPGLPAVTSKSTTDLFVQVFWDDKPSTGTLKVTSTCSEGTLSVGPLTYVIGSLAGRTPTNLRNDTVIPALCSTSSVIISVDQMSLQNTGGTSSVPQDYADGYEWTLPTGWTSSVPVENGKRITESPQITITPDGCADGTIKVRAFYNCGGRKFSNEASLALPRQSPVPLNVTSSNYTGGACGKTTGVTFVAPNISCASTYTWTFSSASGQSTSGWRTTPVVTNTNTLTEDPSGDPSDAGTLVVTIQLNCGTILSTSSFDLTYEAPTISVVSPICYSGSRTVTLNNVTNKVVTWGVSSNITNQTPGSTGNTIQVSAASSITRASGQITAEVTGCGTKTINPWVGPPDFPTPIDGPSQLVVGSGDLYRAVNVGGSNGTFSWSIASPWIIYVSGPTAPNGHAAIVECKSAEIRRVYLTTYNLCGSGTTSKQIQGTTGCTGIESMSVYPNPSTGDFTVMALPPPPPPCESYSMLAVSENDLTTDTELKTQSDLTTLQIYNSRGNKVFEKEFEGDKIELNGLGLKHGQYHIKMFYKGKTLETRLLINK